METITPLESDALVQAKEYLKELSSELGDKDIPFIEKLVGFNPTWAAYGYLKSYSNGNSFMKDMQRKLTNNQHFTDPMIRAILNILRREVRGDAKLPATDSKPYKCFACETILIGYQGLMDHKGSTCPKRKVRCEHCNMLIPADQKCDCQSLDPAITGEQTDFDASMLVGRFALPNPKAGQPDEDSFLYFIGWRRHSQGKRDRSYVYGKFRKRAEVIPAGTIEIKWQRGDTKKLVGEQRPGELYRGEFVEELKVIAQDPQMWARIYGTMLHKCGRCGKSLTDDLSRAFGFGPDCMEIMEQHGWGWHDDKEKDEEEETSTPSLGFIS